LTFELSNKQQEASDAVRKWFINKDLHEEKPIFRLFGYAGTGKTTITNHIIEQSKLSKDQVKFGAFSGKAAMVMKKNQLPATTIHSMIYDVVPPDEKETEKLRMKLVNGRFNDDEKRRIRQEILELSKPHFSLKEQDKLKGIQLIVLDECSMVNNEMLLDILTFDIPLLVLGDPGQLPPIEGKSPLTDVSPDVMLTEIHRQAEGNPVIWLATQARLGRSIPYDTYGDSLVMPLRNITRSMMLGFDQIITGKNVTRREINTRIRDLKGYEGLYPNVGEKLVCLRNRHEDGLFNGMICYVEEILDQDQISIQYKIRKETDTDDDEPSVVHILKAHFDSYKNEYAMDKVKLSDRLSVNEFDFGYAITVHKAQGSQWDNVCLVDDGMFNGYGKPGDRERWLYTGISRAAETVTIAR